MAAFQPNVPTTVRSAQDERLPPALRQAGDPRRTCAPSSPAGEPALPRHPRLRAHGHPRRSSTPFSPATTSSSSACAARPRRASCARSTSLLDERVPIIAGCEINDSIRSQPTCKRCRRLAAEQGDDLPIAWLTARSATARSSRRPTSRRRSLGDIDPIKAANQRLTYADEEVIHYGIIPRTNRGIFAINELPDLAPRIQVALLNILEERDLQIRGFPVRIPMDVVLVFCANPEDYTSRGNIITPLKDRIDSQILTHYPQSVEIGRATSRAQEAWTERDMPARDRDPRLRPRRSSSRSRSWRARSSSSTSRPASPRASPIAAMELLRLEPGAARARDTATARSSRASPTCHAPSGDHRQGRDGLRGRAAGRRSRGAAADRAGGQEGLRRPLPRGRQRGRRPAARTTRAPTPRCPLVRRGQRHHSFRRAAVRRVRGRDPQVPGLFDLAAKPPRTAAPGAGRSAASRPRRSWKVSTST